METYQLGEVEQRFADLIWAEQPLTSSRLVELAAAELGWKKSTTYTVLRRLCQRGLFANENGTVCAVLSRDEFFSRQSRAYVQNSFGGSLPGFIAAFTGNRKLRREEIEQLRRMIEQAEKEE